MGNQLFACNNNVEEIKDVKVLLYGGNGWIGSKVYNLLVQSDNIVIKSKARGFKEIKQEILETKPTHIISCIGRTHGIYEGEEITTIDYLEKPGKLVENIRDNMYTPLLLADICKREQIHFTYLGTGCIFEYSDDFPIEDINVLGKGIKEHVEPNFFGSSYSIVKGYTDKVMRELYENSVLNVRIRMPITSEDSQRNFISKILKYKKICSMPNSMTVLDDLLPVMIELALKGEVGTINLTNPGTMSHNEILELYREIVDPDYTWENFSIDQQNQVLASKRSNNYLNTDKLEKLMENKVKSLKESIKDIFNKMKENKENIL